MINSIPNAVISTSIEVRIVDCAPAHRFIQLLLKESENGLKYEKWDLNESDAQHLRDFLIAALNKKVSKP